MGIFLPYKRIALDASFCIQHAGYKDFTYETEEPGSFDDELDYENPSLTFIVLDFAPHYQIQRSVP